MNVRQQIIQSNIESISEKLDITEDDAFLRLGHSLMTNQSVHSFEEDDLVDGGQDKQIDVITIIEEGDEAYIYLIQSKNSPSFESNIVIQMRNGLNWIFNKSKDQIEEIGNKNLKDKIFSYREMQSLVGTANLHVKVFYISTAIGVDVSDECKQEIKTIIDEYDNNRFASFTYDLISSDEIVDNINSIGKKNKKINVDLKIKYDANTPSLIKYQTEGLTGIICTISASEIARIVNEDKNGYIFDMNIRKYLGTRGKVNQEILSTCSSQYDSHTFWFLNNGITIICDSVDPVTDPDNPHIKIKNMQIVNGCQTSSSLAKAAKEGSLKKDSRVLLRIYQTGDIELVSKIVLTTNNQNKISGRNLRSNDLVQSDLQKGFELYGLYYERKPREFDQVKNANKLNIIPNDVVATAFLAICLGRCGDARSRKYKVWNDFYRTIFHGSMGIEPYIFSSVLYKKIKEELKNDIYSDSDDEKLRYIAKNASFHIARIASFLIRKTFSWKETKYLKEKIEGLSSGNIDIILKTKEAFDILINIVDLNKDLGNLLKSGKLDSEINKNLSKKS